MADTISKTSESYVTTRERPIHAPRLHAGVNTPHPPPQKKYAQWRDKSCDFRSTLAVCISEVNHVADLIFDQHHSCPLIVQMNTRTNVCYASLKFYMQT